MKNNKKHIIICIFIIIVYILGLLFFGYKNNTIKNTKLNTALTEKPRLEDDFYSYINYDKLSQVLIDESKIMDNWTYFKTYENAIKEEKKKIIDNIVSNADTYSSNSVYKKLCDYYFYLKNMNYDENKKILNEYINLINSSNNIEEYQKNIFIINHKLYNANILFNLSVKIKDENIDKAYPSINYMYYDYFDNSNYYNLAKIYEYSQERNWLKKADVKILMEYGYSEAEARKIVSSIYDMYANIAKYSNLKTEKDNYKLYTINELKNKYSNINFELIKNELIDRFGTASTILVVDESQLNLINNYLINDNLETLKKYSLIRILYSYGYTINSNIYDIINELNNIDTTDEDNNKDDILYNDVNSKSKFYF